MHYSPFRFEDYPELSEMRTVFRLDLKSQTAVRSFSYFDGVVLISVMEDCGLVEYFVSLSEPRTVLDMASDMNRRALFYRLSSLEDAEKLDLVRACELYPSQYDVTRAFRNFTQSNGGRRYVALCHDLIDMNMGHSLQPYMAAELVAAVYAGYNKNVNRDIKGLIVGIIDLIKSFEMDETMMRAAWSAIGAKSSSALYELFCRECLLDDVLCVPMQRFLADSLCPGRLSGRETAPYVSVDLFRELPTELICQVLRELPAGMKSFAQSFFGDPNEYIDPDYVRAYMENPAKDMALIVGQPFFAEMPDDIQESVRLIRTFSASASVADWIKYYETSANDGAKEEVLSAARSFGRGELANALEGKPFVLQSFNLSEMEQLMAYVDQNSQTMVSRVSAYLKPYIDRRYLSDTLDRVLAKLEGDLFVDLVSSAVLGNAFRNRAIRLRMADRYRLYESLGYREWNPHA